MRNQSGTTSVNIGYIIMLFVLYCTGLLLLYYYKSGIYRIFAKPLLQKHLKGYFTYDWGYTCFFIRVLIYIFILLKEGCVIY